MSWIPESNSPAYDAQQHRVAESSCREIPLTPVNLYRAEIETFGEAIEKNQAPPIPGHQGLRIQQILAACELSAQSRSMIDLGEVRTAI